MNLKRAHERGGFTIIEALIAMALVGLVLTKLTMVVTQAQKAHTNEVATMVLEDQAAQVLDRVAFAIIGSDADTIDPVVEAPFSTDELSFRISMGVEEGEVIWGNPEQIGLRGDGSQLYWGQNVGEVEERIVVWCNTVSEMLEGELLNGYDDNGNNLDDELGLSFDKNGKSITIRMTLVTVDKEGRSREVTEQTTVTCRN
jgi:type II secretory pathway pseudopilin PulG